MRCRYNNQRNGHNRGATGQGLNNNNSGMTIANSAISGSILGSCSTHCHSSLLEVPNAHYGCGCLVNNYPCHSQHHAQIHQLYRHNSHPYRNRGPLVRPAIERPDFCAWDSCEDR